MLAIPNFRGLNIDQLLAYAKAQAISLSRSEMRSKERIVHRIVREIEMRNPPNRRGQIIDKSESGGYSIQEMWCRLFSDNEMAFAEGRYDDVLTDEQITRVMRKSFPDRKNKVFGCVTRVRACVNGQVQKHPPFFCHKYVRLDNGTVVQIEPRSKGVYGKSEKDEDGSDGDGTSGSSDKPKRDRRRIVHPDMSRSRASASRRA